MVREKCIDQARRCGHIVGAITVNHNVYIRFDIREHAANNIALSLKVNLAHASAGGQSDFSCVVRGVVVEHINSGAGKMLSKISDDLDYGPRLIVTRNHDSNG